eukprot:2211827-Pyramimonas_sp.AAC.1
MYLRAPGPLHPTQTLEKAEVPRSVRGAHLRDPRRAIPVAQLATGARFALWEARSGRKASNQSIGGL